MTFDEQAPGKDMLADVFARQADLANYYQTMRPDGFYSWPPLNRCATWTRAIVHECCDLDNELNWKPWKNSRDLAANREERLFEMADIFHFFVQLALDQGFSASEIYAAYIAKSDENRRRQQSDPATSQVVMMLISPELCECAEYPTGVACVTVTC